MSHQTIFRKNVSGECQEMINGGTKYHTTLDL